MSSKIRPRKKDCDDSINFAVDKVRRCAAKDDQRQNEALRATKGRMARRQLIRWIMK